MCCVIVNLRSTRARVNADIETPGQLARRTRIINCSSIQNMASLFSPSQSRYRLFPTLPQTLRLELSLRPCHPFVPGFFAEKRDLASRHGANTADLSPLTPRIEFESSYKADLMIRPHRVVDRMVVIHSLFPSLSLRLFSFPSFPPFSAFSPASCDLLSARPFLFYPFLSFLGRIATPRRHRLTSTTRRISSPSIHLFYPIWFLGFFPSYPRLTAQEERSEPELPPGLASLLGTLMTIRS